MREYDNRYGVDFINKKSRLYGTLCHIYDIWHGR